MSYVISIIIGWLGISYLFLLLSKEFKKKGFTKWMRLLFLSLSLFSCFYIVGGLDLLVTDYVLLNNLTYYNQSANISTTQNVLQAPLQWLWIPIILYCWWILVYVLSDWYHIIQRWMQK